MSGGKFADNLQGCNFSISDISDNIINRFKTEMGNHILHFLGFYHGIETQFFFSKGLFKHLLFTAQTPALAACQSGDRFHGRGGGGRTDRVDPSLVVLTKEGRRALLFEVATQVLAAQAIDQHQVVVVCGELQYADDQRDTILNPSLIVEVILPASLTWLSLLLVRALLPKNFFIYVFINAFFTGGAAAVLSALVTALLLVYGSSYSWETLSHSYLPYFPLMFFPEAVLNGWIMTILVGLKPEWVFSFRDEEYLHGK